MKVKGLRWVVLGMICLVAVINYLDRGTLNYMWIANIKVEYPATNAVLDEASQTYTLTNEDGAIQVPKAGVTVKENGSYEYTKVGGIAVDLGIIDPNLPSDEFKAESKRLLAMITIFFMIAYGISQLFSGKIYDKIGTRKGFTFSAVLWGLADALTSTAVGFRSIVFFRFMLGLGEAGPWPGVTKSNAEWFPTKVRAFAQGLFGAATSIGAVLAPIVISLLFLAYGWKVTFIIIGSLAFLWVIPWYIINKSTPKTHPWITDEEKEYILTGQPEATMTAEEDKALSWGQLLSQKKNYSLILGRFFLDPVWWMFVTFIPIYLLEVYNLDIKQIAMSAWVPYVGSGIGCIIGGWYSGWLISRGKSVNYARKCSLIIGTLIALPGIVGAALATTPLMAVLMMALILGGYQFYSTNMQVLAADLQNGKTVGSLAGLGGASAVAGVILAMIVIPMITKAGWLPFFILGGCLFPLSLLSIFFTAGTIGKKDK